MWQCSTLISYEYASQSTFDVLHAVNNNKPTTILIFLTITLKILNNKPHTKIIVITTKQLTPTNYPISMYQLSH